ncbi:MAG TPA: hypothetical protein PK014_10185 [Thermoanaerobaculia bacterium]|nr:hypothetical protein [Thermoanaerobaculia bacterium]HUM30487.1 hypothetical protein [Thermoanaerobaculia bacterium]HXK68646.1 hypothetical protein [Thermoanaerobaculia bacterium]
MRQIDQAGVTAGTLVHHRSVKVPHFFHTATLKPYELVSRSILSFDPLKRQVLPPSSQDEYRVVSRDALRESARTLSEEVILIPHLPPEDRILERLEDLCNALYSRGNAILVHVEGPPFPSLPSIVTPLVSLFPVMSGQTDLDSFFTGLSALAPCGIPVLFFPLLPGISDGHRMAVLLSTIRISIPTSCVVPMVPLLDHVSTTLILDLVDRGQGDAGRAYHLLFQTARSEIDRRLMDEFFESFKGPEFTGLIPLQTANPLRKENLMWAQRCYLLWHSLLERGDDDVAWAWYRAARKIWGLNLSLSTMFNEGNLSLLELDGRIMRSLSAVFQGEESRLDPVEVQWMP